MPTFKSAGTPVQSTLTVTVTVPAGVAAGDAIVAFASSVFLSGGFVSAQSNTWSGTPYFGPLGNGTLAAATPSPCAAAWLFQASGVEAGGQITMAVQQSSFPPSTTISGLVAVYREVNWNGTVFVGSHTNYATTLGWTPATVDPGAAGSYRVVELWANTGYGPGSVNPVALTAVTGTARASVSGLVADYPSSALIADTPGSAGPLTHTAAEGGQLAQWVGYTLWLPGGAVPTRQYPRDDNLALGSTRQSIGSNPSSLQSSIRQGWRGTYT